MPVKVSAAEVLEAGFLQGRHIGQLTAGAWREVTASARVRPCSMKGSATDTWSKLNCTWPPSRSVVAGALPL